MAFTANFTDISKSDVGKAGGKGASLGEMTQAGIPVPPGFVVLASSFDEFLKVTDLDVELDAILDHVDHSVMHEVDAASEKIKALIMAKEMPQPMAEEVTSAFKELGAEFVAVRSSATSEDSADAAWAGQLNTYLNTTEEKLIENVKKCWASLFTPRAIFYRFEKGLHGKPISVAVVVQKMIQSEVSGIAFSVHPVTQDYDQLIIEAGFGLGEAIVSGSITPDSFVIEKNRWAIIDKNITTQERGLYRKEKGGPEKSADADLGASNEWRDIPTDKGEQPTLSDDQAIELAKLIVKIEQHYGFPVDVEWAREGGNFYITQSRPITTLTKKPDSEAEDIVSKAQKIEWRHWLERPYGPFITTLTYAGVADKYFDEVGLPDFGYNVNFYQFPHLYLSVELDKKNYQVLQQYLNNHTIFDISALLQTTHENNKREMQDIIADNISALEKLKKAREILRTYFPYLWIIEPLGEYYNQRIADEVPKYIKKEVDKFVGDASVSPKKNEYTKMLDMLHAGAPLEEVRKQYGWLKSRDGFTDFYTIEELGEIQKNHVQPEAHKVEIPEQLQKLALELQELTYFRTDRTDKYYEMLGIARPIFQEVAEHLGIKFEELEACDADAVLAGEVKKVEKPFNFLYMDGEQIIQAEKIIDFKQDLSGEVTGISAFRGKAQGRVKIVRHPSEVEKVEAGDILVTQMTLPSFIAAMQKAVAFVTDEGGITCHAAIVSREMKKPCIIGTKTATQVLKDGDMVEVDADKGIVRKIDN